MTQPAESVERCTSHHYMTGWICQRAAGHVGPCLADANINSRDNGPYITTKGKRGVFAWHQPAGEPACNQTPCADPNNCRCTTRSALRRRRSATEGK